MARSKTPLFVVDVALIVDSASESELLSRLQASRQLYDAGLHDAGLHETISRIELMRQSDVCRAVWQLLKSKARTPAFAEARKACGRVKKVRDKVPTRLRSWEGKTNQQTIRWKAHQFIGGKLVMPADSDWAD